MQPHRSLSTGSSAPAPSASAAPSMASGFAAAGVMGGATLMASRAKTAKNSKIIKARSQKSMVYAKKDITESGLDHLVASVQELLKHLVLYTSEKTFAMICFTDPFLFLPFFPIRVRTKVLM